MLNGRRSLDPRWIKHHRRVPEGFMIHDIVIYRMSEDPVVLDPATGQYSGGELLPLWSGKARIQPNKDWRARTVESGSDPQMLQYTRVQIPLKADNPVPTLRVQDIIAAQEMEDTDDWVFNNTLTAWTMYIRNAENSSNRWLYNILCNSDLSDMEEGSG